MTRSRVELGMEGREVIDGVHIVQMFDHVAGVVGFSLLMAAE